MFTSNSAYRVPMEYIHRPNLVFGHIWYEWPRHDSLRKHSTKTARYHSASNREVEFCSVALYRRYWLGAVVVMETLGGNLVRSTIQIIIITASGYH